MILDVIDRRKSMAKKGALVVRQRLANEQTAVGLVMRLIGPEAYDV
jgi:hypothetical protein